MSEVYKVIMKCDEWADGSEKFDVTEKRTRGASRDFGMEMVIAGGVIVVLVGVTAGVVYYTNKN